MSSSSEIANCAAKCFCGSDKTWEYNEERPPHQFADGRWDNLAHRIIKQLVISNHQCSMFEHSSNRCIDEAKDRRSRNTLQKRAPKPSRAHEDDIYMQSTLCVVAVQNWIQKKMLVNIETFILELNQEEVTALAHQEPPQPTQPELVVEACQEAGFKNTIDICQFFRTRPQSTPHGRWIVPACKEFHKARSIVGSRL